MCNRLPGRPVCSAVPRSRGPASRSPLPYSKRTPALPRPRHNAPTVLDNWRCRSWAVGSMRPNCENPDDPVDGRAGSARSKVRILPGAPTLSLSQRSSCTRPTSAVRSPTRSPARSLGSQGSPPRSWPLPQQRCRGLSTPNGCSPAPSRRRRGPSGCSPTRRRAADRAAGSFESASSPHRPAVERRAHRGGGDGRRAISRR